LQGVCQADALQPTVEHVADQGNHSGWLSQIKSCNLSL